MTAVFLCSNYFTPQDQEGKQSRSDEEYEGEEKVSPRAVILWFISSSNSVSTTFQQVVEYGGKMQLIFCRAPIHTFWIAWTRTRRPLPNVKLISELRRLMFLSCTSHSMIIFKCFTGCKASKLKLQHVSHGAIMVQGTVDCS